MKLKLVVAYDESKSSQAALAVAIQRAKAFIGSVVYLVRSLTRGEGDDLGIIETSEQSLDQVCRKLTDDGIACKTHVLIRGFDPGEDIVLFARDIQADEIFVGIEKRSRVEKVLMGSTAQFVVLNAHCPVTTVK